MPAAPPRPLQLAMSPTATSTCSSPASASTVASPGSTFPTPNALTPQLAIKPSASNAQASAMAAVALTTSLPPKNSVTSKEWVVPPRPKPGRKPATDTPPTKRKAQNRAAQRAFRERRAARVGELEELLEEQKQEHDRIEEDLEKKVHSLETEVQTLTAKNSSLEDLLDKERAESSRLSHELNLLRRRWRDEDSSFSNSRNPSLSEIHGRSHSLFSQHHTPRTSIASHTSGHRRSTAFPISQIISPPDSSVHEKQHESSKPIGCGGCQANGPCSCVDDVLDAAPVGCGKCSIGTRCACLEAAMSGLVQNRDSELKRRPSSPIEIAPDEKRQKADYYPNEIDFTHAFSKKKQASPEPMPAPALPPPTQGLVPPRDSCGFCTEGTYCPCAEEAAAAATPQPLAPMSHQVQTPPPDNDFGPSAFEVTSTGAIKLPSIRSLNRNAPPPPRKTGGGCGPGGPGTCAQCVADPKSGLFCRSLAASFGGGKPGSEGAGGGCCGGSGAGGGCCKSKTNNNNNNSGGATPSEMDVVPINRPQLGNKLSLSCADAYRTLASHRNFSRAADNIEDWLPRLRAIPQPQEIGGSARPPIEVETASIMSVLKGFDVRFGREA